MLVTVEGIECVGKTPIAKMIVNSLKEMGYPSIYTYEPTNGPYGRIIRLMLRGIIKDTWKWERGLLFALDRAWHVANVIEPMIRRNIIVVCDRYIHSQLAYQAAEGLTMTVIEELNREFPIPDIVVFLDSEPKYALRRVSEIMRRGDISKSSIYNEEVFLNKVREHYMRYIQDKRFTKDYVIINIDKEIGTDIIANEEFRRKALNIVRSKVIPKIISYVRTRT